MPRARPAGSFLIFNPGPSNTIGFSVNVANNDGFDLTKITFDLTNTEAGAAGTQTLVFGGSFGVVPRAIWWSSTLRMKMAR